MYPARPGSAVPSFAASLLISHSVVVSLAVGSSHSRRLSAASAGTPGRLTSTRTQVATRERSVSSARIQPAGPRWACAAAGECMSYMEQSPAENGTRC